MRPTDSGPLCPQLLVRVSSGPSLYEDTNHVSPKSIHTRGRTPGAGGRPGWQFRGHGSDRTVASDAGGTHQHFVRLSLGDRSLRGLGLRLPTRHHLTHRIDPEATSAALNPPPQAVVRIGLRSRPRPMPTVLTGYPRVLGTCGQGTSGRDEMAVALSTGKPVGSPCTCANRSTAKIGNVANTIVPLCPWNQGKSTRLLWRTSTVYWPSAYGGCTLKPVFGTANSWPLGFQRQRNEECVISEQRPQAARASARASGLREVPEDVREEGAAGLPRA